MEWNAVKSLMAEEQIDIAFDIPSDLELSELIISEFEDADDDDEDSLYA